VFSTTRATRLFRQLPRHESEILRKELQPDEDATPDSGSLAFAVAVGWGGFALLLAGAAMVQFALA
jgi:hypothetical protein